MTVQATREQNSLPRKRRELGMWLLGILVTLATVVVAMFMPVQVTLVGVGVLAALILHRRVAVVVFAVLIVPTISLLRRVAAGKTGYTSPIPSSCSR